MTNRASRHRVLVLTAGYGEGHNAAARALAAAFDGIAGPGTASVVDAFALASPRINRLTRQIYLRLINDAPLVWSRIYAWIDRSRFGARQLWIFRREIAVLAERIAEERPHAICCTYPLYAFFLEEIVRRDGQLPPIYNIVTDSISIHSLWWRARCDGWFLPNQDSADVVLAAGIAPSTVHVSGFPVPSFFALNAGTLCPPDLATGARPRVLHIINSGTNYAAETARRLLARNDWDVTCAVGRDENLRSTLARFAARRSRPASILGWTDQIPRLLMTHHAVVTKAGGATTQEAIAALCPMIVNQIVPGQEEGNYELLRRHGSGALATTPSAVMAALEQAFANDGRVWRQWRAVLRPLARTDAADDIASRVLGGRAHAAPAWSNVALQPSPATTGLNSLLAMATEARDSDSAFGHHGAAESNHSPRPRRKGFP